MIIELKNVKYFASNSEETYCYKASLYIDGVKAGVVSNDGHGGCDRFEGDRALYQSADNWLKENETLDLEQLGTSVPMCMDSKCAELVTQWLQMRDYKKVSKNSILFTKEGDGAVYISRTDPKKVTDFKALAEKSGLTGVDKVLNEMPDDEALKLYVNAE